jgi:hypothetical protein
VIRDALAHTALLTRIRGHMLQFREIAAFLLHRLANGLIAVSLGLQKLAFMVEFGSRWQSVRTWHYRKFPQ